MGVGDIATWYGLTWSGWGTKQATGTGMFRFYGPDGSLAARADVPLLLSRRQRCGVPIYTRVTTTYPAEMTNPPAAVRTLSCRIGVASLGTPESPDPTARPRTIATGIEGEGLSKIRWRSWRGASARGRGIQQTNCLSDNCSNGSIIRRRVRITVYNAGPCGAAGALMYRKIRTRVRGHRSRVFNMNMWCTFDNE